MSNNPYRSPVEAGVLPSSIADRYKFRSTGFFTKSICIGLAVFSIARLSPTVLDSLGAIGIYGDSMPAPPQPQVSLTYVLLLLSRIMLLLSYTWIVVFVVLFTYRANANLRALSIVGLRHSPEVASVFWFIPILNLFKPYQEMRDVLDETNKNIQIADDRSEAPVGIWWTAWLVGDISARLAYRMQLSETILGTTYFVLSWLSTICLLGAALLLVSVLFSIQTGQDRLNDGVVDVID